MNSVRTLLSRNSTKARRKIPKGQDHGISRRKIPEGYRAQGLPTVSALTVVEVQIWNCRLWMKFWLRAPAYASSACCRVQIASMMFRKVFYLVMRLLFLRIQYAEPHLQEE